MNAIPAGEQRLLSIGEVADKTGVSVSTLRYYHELGIISPVTRVGGQRRFDKGAIPLVSFIRTAQTAGFSLEQISQLVDNTMCSSTDLVAEKIDVLHAQREEITGMIQLLEDFARCGCAVLSDCSLSSVQDPAVHLSRK